MSIGLRGDIKLGGEYRLPCWEQNFSEGLLEQDVL
jgi:hypothetical protein